MPAVTRGHRGICSKIRPTHPGVHVHQPVPGRCGGPNDPFPRHEGCRLAASQPVARDLVAMWYPLDVEKWMALVNKKKNDTLVQIFPQNSHECLPDEGDEQQRLFLDFNNSYPSLPECSGRVQLPIAHYRMW